MKSYERYVRKQLSAVQNGRLDSLVSQLGLMYFDNGGFNEMLSDLSNIDERIKTEIPFLIRSTGMKVTSRVDDVSLGSGATSIGLKQYGIKTVYANEIDDDFRRIAQKELVKRNIKLTIRDYDWRELHNFLPRQSGWIDIILCTGNSLTYIMQPKEQQEIVNTFAGLLDEGGKLVIDTRNYTELLRGNFRNSGKGPYKGLDKITIDPLYVSTDMTLFRYTHKEKDISGDLLLYPFKDGEIECLMRTAGLKDIKIYGDYKSEFNPKTVDFYTIIGTKS